MMIVQRVLATVAQLVRTQEQTRFRAVVPMASLEPSVQMTLTIAQRGVLETVLAAIMVCPRFSRRTCGVVFVTWDSAQRVPWCDVLLWYE